MLSVLLQYAWIGFSAWNNHLLPYASIQVPSAWGSTLVRPKDLSLGPATSTHSSVSYVWHLHSKVSPLRGHMKSREMESVPWGVRVRALSLGGLCTWKVSGRWMVSWSGCCGVVHSLGPRLEDGSRCSTECWQREPPLPTGTPRSQEQPKSGDWLARPTPQLPLLLAEVVSVTAWQPLFPLPKTCCPLSSSVKSMNYGVRLTRLCHLLVVCSWLSHFPKSYLVLL